MEEEAEDEDEEAFDAGRLKAVERDEEAGVGDEDFFDCASAGGGTSKLESKAGDVRVSLGAAAAGVASSFGGGGGASLVGWGDEASEE